VEALALWGIADETPLTLENIRWNTGDVLVTVIPGRLRLDLCREGGTRLFNASGRTQFHGSRPNPFNAVTLIDYEIGEAGATELAVYDALGRRVEVLANGDAAPGLYSAAFDATDYPSGAYVAILRSATTVSYRWLMLAK
jgi:hypothetical protein